MTRSERFCCVLDCPPHSEKHFAFFTRILIHEANGKSYPSAPHRRYFLIVLVSDKYKIYYQYEEDSKQKASGILRIKTN